MAEVVSEISVQASPETCYRIASDMEKFPNFMPNVLDITVLDKGDDWTITRWDAKFQGRPITWEERDDFDGDNLVINYDQTEGDLKVFRGCWTFEPEEGGCRIKLTVDASLGIPMLEAALDPLVRKVVRDNCNSMLEGIKAEAEGG